MHIVPSTTEQRIGLMTTSRRVAGLKIDATPSRTSWVGMSALEDVFVAALQPLMPGRSPHMSCTTYHPAVESCAGVNMTYYMT